MTIGQMLVQEGRPGMHLIVLDRHYWTYAQIEKLVLTSAENISYMPQRTIQLVRV